MCSFLSSLSPYEAAPKQKERETEKRRESVLKRRGSGKTRNDIYYVTLEYFSVNEEGDMHKH